MSDILIDDIAGNIMGVLGGGKKIPSTYSDPFTRADGAIKGNWLGNGVISSNFMVNTPSYGPELLTNGNMESGSPPSSWTATNCVLTADAADKNSGTQSLRYTANGGGTAKAKQNVTTTAGLWYRAIASMKGGNINESFQIRDSGDTILAGHATASSTSVWGQRTLTGRADSASCGPLFLMGVSTNGNYARGDDASFMNIPFAGMMNVVKLNHSNPDISVGVTIPVGKGLMGGVVACLDSISDPKNFIITYIDGVSIWSVQYIAGVPTEIVPKTAITYADDAIVRFQKSGTATNIFYNGAQVGTTNALIDPPSNYTYHGIFSTDPTVKFTDFSVSLSSSIWLQQFAWMSDVHVGRTWAAGEVDAAMAAIKAHNNSFVLSTGDNIENGLQAEADSFNASTSIFPTIYKMDGNHDVQGGLTPFTKHFTFDSGTLRFICFFADYVSTSEGSISVAELAWVLNQLQNLGGQTPILCCHWSLISGFTTDWHIGTVNAGQATLLSYCSTYGVKVFLSGHTHATLQTIVSAGTTHINGPAMVENISAFMECFVSANQLIIQTYGSRTPFAYINSIKAALA
jgi:hypothetical protein